MKGLLVLLAGLSVGCSGRDWHVHDHESASDHALPWLDPTRPVPEDERSIQYSLVYEDRFESDTEFIGPASVALEYEGDPLSFRAWCVDVHHSIDSRITRHGKLYSSYETIPSGSALVHPENLDLANYLVSKHPVRSTFARDDHTEFTVTNDDMQNALWTLVSSGPLGGLEEHRSREIAALVAAARANGEGFVPRAGEHATMIVVARVNLDDGSDEDDVQTLAIDVRVPGDPQPSCSGTACGGNPL